MGIEYASEASVNRILERVPATYKNGRLHFLQDNLLSHFEHRKEQLRASHHDREEITLGGGWNSWYLCDPVTNLPRYASEEEASKMARLAESLGAGRGPIPVGTQNKNPDLYTLTCERIALKNTVGMGGCLTATNQKEIEILLEMYQVANRRYLLALEPLISPLRLNPEVLDIYFQWENHPALDITIFTPIPMAGATAPLVFPAALVQVLAEALALDYIFFNLSEGALTEGFSLRLDPFDMRDSNIAFGSPEWSLLRQSLLELWYHLFGRHNRFGLFRTNGKTVSAQSVQERATSFMWQVSCGVRHFSAVGQMSVDEVYSPVMAIVDRELARYGNRLLTGLEPVWNDGLDSLQVIRDGLSTNSFLGTDSTVDYYRRLFDFDRFSDASNYSTWLRNDKKSMERYAWEQAQEIINAHKFTLSKEQENEIDAIFQRYSAQIS